jgi:hypothetical protein
MNSDDEEAFRRECLAILEQIEGMFHEMRVEFREIDAIFDRIEASTDRIKEQQTKTLELLRAMNAEHETDHEPRR